MLNANEPCEAISNSKLKIHHSKFNIVRAILLLAFLVALDTGITKWRSSAPTSTAPVWSLPMMDEAIANPGKFQRAIDVYSADRGGEVQLDGPEDAKLTVFYFEWDQVAPGPITDFAGHTPEECNILTGLKLMGHLPQRSFSLPTGEPLHFDVTEFHSPAGELVFMFKAAWLQGQGSWEIRQGTVRDARLKRSFMRTEGQARVIEAGVTGSISEPEAWSAFESKVLQGIAAE